VTNSTYQEDFNNLLACVPVNDRAKAELSATMSAKDRFYHDAAHLALLWRRHRIYSAAEGLAAPEVEPLIACAIAYHDCVHDSRRRDNEERSAEIWMEASAGAPLTAENRQWVADTILATRDHLGYFELTETASLNHDRKSPAELLRERGRIWFLDLDLTPLGETAEDFDSNTASLRREASHLSNAEWDATRLSFLLPFLQAPQIFRSPALAAIFEAPARLNLLRCLRQA
jgi:predicted metal-dependent HD superfamily phosphohydrolase